MPLGAVRKLVVDRRAPKWAARASQVLLLGLMASFPAPARAGGAPSLTGTWGIGNGTGLAKCRAVLVDGTSASSLYTIGPLEITQSGTAIYVRSFERALHYQGAANLTSEGTGGAVATSCAATTGTPSDVPGTFHFSKVSTLKNAMQGTFVGRWQNSGETLSCKFSATRTSSSDPMIAACP